LFVGRGLKPHLEWGLLFLKGDSSMPKKREYSEKVAAEINEEVKLVLEQAHFAGVYVGGQMRPSSPS
jgi:ATP-dependent Zn protease